MAIKWTLEDRAIAAVLSPDSSRLSFHLANGLFTKAAKESVGCQVQVLAMAM